MRPSLPLLLLYVSHYLSLPLFILPFLPPSLDPSPVLKLNRLGLAVYPLFGVRQVSPRETGLSLNDLSLRFHFRRGNVDDHFLSGNS